ncbi:winged helix-turn-helix transcriptional regulator [Streptomyces sp. NPDC059909]|uniref:winged helix-turn-helix transcriptional regulator n=1 Tax=Streptomyces sp. NPDC059909 TaxID=3346998 RepID=UPI00365FA16D
MASDEPRCSIQRSLQVLGERWSLLTIREIFSGRHRFAEIQSVLGVASNLLTTRLKKLVDAGVLRQQTYQEPGSRTRVSYHLTPAGEELLVILAALQQWGDRHCPHPSGPAVLRRQRSSGHSVHVGLISDTNGHEIPIADVDMVSVEPG